ncbi:hypothetical protein [Streptomyces sp. NBC_01235]|uniref:hypothetical protein n=1 Tax=Streptomyces sp. NBC_01235 TaxID=2903788 RepID=UPI002E131F2C|nr:hypothetical protein OG289_04735 [Streptomyces sp. NBC_01235]
MTMSDPEQLIAGPWPAGPVNRGEIPRPGTALVFSLDTGEPVVLDRRPSFLESTRFHYRYEVDITDHHTNWQDPLPSRTKGFAFHAEISTAWRVSSPDVVVKRRLTTLATAEALVRGALNDLLRPHTRGFDIEDVARAEDSANRSLRSREHTFDSGLTVFACAVRLGLDETAERHLRQQRDLAWQREQATLTHQVNRVQTEGEQELTSLVEEHEARRVRERTAALRAAQRGEGGLLMHLVAQDPSQLRSILQEIAARQDMALERKQALLRDLKGDLHPAEYAEWVQRFMGEPLPYAGPALGGETPSPLPRSHTPAPTGTRDGATGTSRPEPATGTGGPRPDEPGSGVVGWRAVGRRGPTPRGDRNRSEEDDKG